MYDTENNKALVRLLESSDLVKMLEDLISPSSLTKLSPAVISGVRVTLRNIRESILASHDSFAAEHLKGNRTNPALDRGSSAEREETFSIADDTSRSAAGSSETFGSAIEFTSKTAVGSGPQVSIPVRRSDLRSSLQKIVERT